MGGFGKKIELAFLERKCNFRLALMYYKSFLSPPICEHLLFHLLTSLLLLLHFLPWNCFHTAFRECYQHSCMLTSTCSDYPISHKVYHCSDSNTCSFQTHPFYFTNISPSDYHTCTYLFNCNHQRVGPK